MGAWSKGIFGNDAALDWLDALSEATEVGQIDAIVRAPFVACAAFARDSVDGVIVTRMTEAELAKTIEHAVSEIASAREKKQIEKMLREDLSGPIEDFGARPAQQCVAAVAYVLWRAGGDVDEPQLRALRKPAAKSYVPSAEILRESRAAIELIADHRERLRQDRAWKTKIAALRAGLAAIPAAE